MNASAELRREPWLTASSDAQRAYLQHALLALVVYAAFAVVGQIEAMFDVIERADAIRMAAFNLSGAAGFALAIRSGANRRVRSDPALMQAQCLFAIAALSYSYAVQAEARGGVLSIAVLILVFGMFALTGAQAVRVSVLTGAMLGAVMMWKSQTDPTHFPPMVELMHFLMTSVAVFGVAVFSLKLARMRQHLSQQNVALSGALEQIRRLATRDDLTGLLNRRHMCELLAAEKLRHERTGDAISVVLIDLDLFKHINDEHGHAAGDEVLKTFAQTAADGLRAIDMLARWGGEEFLLMLPATDAASAMLCVERIRAGLAKVSFAAIEPGLQVTFSAGVSVLGANDTMHSLVERADKAMYSAKRAGRDCTVIG